MSAPALRKIATSLHAYMAEQNEGVAYSAIGKEVMRDDKHFADAADPNAASLIVLALNSHVDPMRLSVIARQIDAQAEMVEQGLDG